MDLHREAILRLLRIPSGFFYLATPYSKYPGGLEAAFIAACKMAAGLTKLEIPVFSPIAHSHPIAMHGGIDPLDHALWLPADEPMMEAAHGLIVGTLPSWEESYGVSVEIDTFRRAGKPFHFLSPESLYESA